MRASVGFPQRLAFLRPRFLYFKLYAKMALCLFCQYALPTCQSQGQFANYELLLIMNYELHEIAVAVVGVLNHLLIT